MTTTTEHLTHDRLPSGFTYADQHQAAEYTSTGSVNGAVKYAWVRDDFDFRPRLAVRLRPPTSLDEVRSTPGRHDALVEARVRPGTDPLAFYIAEYNRGWAASRRGSTAEWDSGYSVGPYDDGYLDAAAGRMKWHLTYCADHDTCGEG